jgi:hypothetical protein
MPAHKFDTLIEEAKAWQRYPRSNLRSTDSVFRVARDAASARHAPTALDNRKEMDQ